MNRLVCSVLCGALSFAPAAFAAERVYKWTDEKGVVHYGDQPPEGVESSKVAVKAARGETVEEPAEPAPAAPAEPRPSPKSNCAMVKENLATFDKADEVEMDRDGDGEPEKLDAEARAAERARQEQLVSIYCQDE